MAKQVPFFSSLRFRFTLVLALFSGILMVAVLTLIERNLQDSLIRENIDKGIGIARGVAFNVEDPLLTGDDLYLFSALKNAARTPGLVYALIVDHSGMIRAADRTDRVGVPFHLPTGAEQIGRGDDFSVRRLPTDPVPILDLEVPILTLGDPPIRLGEIHLGLSEGLIAAEIGAMRLRLALLTAVALAVGGTAAYLLAGLFVRPVRSLVAGVRAIGEGNLEQHIQTGRRDEIGLLTEAFNEMAASLREKEFLKTTFERYVSRPLARQILEHKDELRLGGEEKEVTVLFADIRRFTSLAEELPPAQVVEQLNEYFSAMIEVVMENGGMVDKLMGDSVMALFGAPLPLGDDPMRAVRCGWLMQQKLLELNRDRSTRRLPPLEMGIGINTGPVVAGNIGSSSRMEYTVIGDTVNVAARLQGLAGPGDILLSEETRRLIEDRIVTSPRETMSLKGKSQTVAVYRLDALLGNETPPPPSIS